MKFHDMPASTIFEFVSMILLASLLAGVGVLFASSIAGSGLSSAVQLGDVSGIAFFQKQHLWALPIPVIVAVGVTHLHAYFYMKEVRKHTDDQAVVAVLRKVVWRYECISCLLALVTATLVIMQTVK